MLSSFIEEKVKGLLNSIVDIQLKKWYDQRQENEIRAEINKLQEKLERESAGTVIETDRFQIFYDTHTFEKRILRYVLYPEYLDISKEMYVEQLVKEYEDSLIENNDKLQSSDRNIIYSFVLQIMEFAYQMKLQELGNSERISLLIQLQLLARIHDDINKVNEFIHRVVMSAESEDDKSSAIVYQIKFLNPMLLEDIDGPCLSQVYINPKCRAKATETMDALEFVASFINSRTENVLFIEGAAGIGKSSFVASLSQRYNEKQYIYYSLKDLLTKKGELGFRDGICGECKLGNNTVNKILFLDGYDEVHSRLDPGIFNSELKWFIDRKMKLIITSRPGYVPYSKLKMPFTRTNLMLFDKDQIKNWLANYRNVKPGLMDSTYDALIADNVSGQIEEIRRIPIMLYIMANRNLEVDKVTCMGDLYKQVFESLKSDKADPTSDMLEKHYEIAKCMAFHMEAENILTVTEGQVRQWCKELFDETFYSSAYIGAHVIEGKSAMEFVHKSIMEFFAAQWIWKCFACEHDMIQVLGKLYLSKEILNYLVFFYKDEEANKVHIEELITRAFRTFVNEGIVFEEDELIDIERYQLITSCLFYNFSILIKTVLERRIFGDVIDLQESGNKASRILRNYLFDAFAKPAMDRQILCGEDFTNLYNTTFLDFLGMNLKRAVFMNERLKQVSFEESHLQEAVFKNMSFTKVNFRYANLSGASFDKIESDASSLNGIDLSCTNISNWIMPKRSLGIRSMKGAHLIRVEFNYNTLRTVSFSCTEIENSVFTSTSLRECSFQGAIMNNVRFFKVTFNKCDFSGIENNGISFINCSIDEATKKSNMDLFSDVLKEKSSKRETIK